MENSAKSIILIFLIALSPGSFGQKNGVTALPSGESKRCIGKGLYCDSANTVYLKVVNRGGYHPSTRRGMHPNSLYLDQIYEMSSNSFKQFGTVADPVTFRQIDEHGFYFKDTAHLFMYMPRPVPEQFYCLPLSGFRFLDRRKYYLLVDSTLYFQGMKVEQIDVKKVSVLSINDTVTNDVINFVTDGKKIFNTENEMDESNLEFYNLSKKDREHLRKMFFAKK